MVGSSELVPGSTLDVVPTSVDDDAGPLVDGDPVDISVVGDTVGTIGVTMPVVPAGGATGDDVAPTGGFPVGDPVGGGFTGVGIWVDPVGATGGVTPVVGAGDTAGTLPEVLGTGTASSLVVPPHPESVKPHPITTVPKRKESKVRIVMILVVPSKRRARHSRDVARRTRKCIRVESMSRNTVSRSSRSFHPRALFS